MQQPCQRELRGRYRFLCGDLFEQLDKLEIVLEVVTLKSRQAIAPRGVAGGEILDVGDDADEQPSSERTIGDEANAELADRRQYLGLDVSREQRVFGLQRRDPMDCVRSFECR